MTATAPPDWAIELAERTAAESPCAKSKRGVVAYDRDSNHIRTAVRAGFNGPPRNTPCPGREACGDRCNKLCVHAEMHALRGISDGIIWRYGIDAVDLVHVKLGADGRVTAGGPPSCWQCSREILDVGFVTGVWLYELSDWLGVRMPPGRWRYYTAADFHAVTLRNAGLS